MIIKVYFIILSQRYFLEKKIAIKMKLNIFILLLVFLLEASPVFAETEANPKENDEEEKKKSSSDRYADKLLKE